MKKFLSVILSAVLLTSLLTVFASAKGTLIFKDDFSKGFLASNWIIDRNACHFDYNSDRKCIYGFDDAKVLQTNYTARKEPKMWDQFYASYRVQFSGYGDKLPEDYEKPHHAMSIWYRDLFETKGEGMLGPVYYFTVNVDTKKASLTKSNSNFAYINDSGVTVKDQNLNGVIAEDVDVSRFDIQCGEDAPWFTLGIRVTPGKIECYINEECVITGTVNENDEKVGPYAVNSVDPTVGSQKSPVLFCNDYCYVSINQFEVWSPDYDFVAYAPGDADMDGGIGVGDAIIVLQHVANWQDLNINLDAADVNCDGNVTIDDAILILQKAAGWDVVLGEKQ